MTISKNSKTLHRYTYTISKADSQSFQQVTKMGAFRSSSKGLLRRIIGTSAELQARRIQGVKGGKQVGLGANPEEVAFIIMAWRCLITSAETTYSKTM